MNITAIQSKVVFIKTTAVYFLITFLSRKTFWTRKIPPVHIYVVLRNKKDLSHHQKSHDSPKQNNFSFRSWLLTWMLWYWYMLLSHEAMVLIRGVVVSFGPTRGQCETFQLGFYYPSQPNSDCKEPSQISLVGSQSPRIWLTKCSIDTSWNCLKALHW